MQNAHVLDVGCGLGVDSILAYTHFNARVVAFDLAEKQIKHCQKRSTELRESRRFDFVACDVEDMGLVLAKNELVPPGGFDFVISNGAFCLIPDKKKAFARVFDVLKQSGVFSICCTVVKGDALAGEFPVCMRMFAPIESLQTWLNLLDI